MKTQTETKKTMKELIQALIDKDYDHHSALYLSDDLFEHNVNGEYKTIDKEELYKAMCTLLKRKNRIGMIGLFGDEIMGDGDIREILIHRPTHCVLTWGIYLKNCRPDLFDEDIDAMFQTLLVHVFESGIYAHGIDGYIAVNKARLMYVRAGALDFIEKNPIYALNFTRYMKECIAFLQEQAGTGKITDEFGEALNTKNMFELFVRKTCYEKKYPIFVYGTLMKGQSAHSYLDNSIFYEKCLLRGYAMYDLGWYPGIKQKENETVQGEVYFVDEQTLNAMDGYEGSLYERKRVSVDSHFGNIKTFVYVYKERVMQDIMRTKWNSQKDQYVWYAAYGSNLNSNRFKHYIQGGQYEENGKEYQGCRDKTLWKETESAVFPGQVYFAKKSSSWNNQGVAFFDERIKDHNTYMQLYKITQEQLEDVHFQEGLTWYAKWVCLGIHLDGYPIYTLTNENRLPSNNPSQRYVEVFKEALKGHVNNKEELEQYIEDCMNA